MDFIPVHRPHLPLAHSITPYLTRIDQSRWYSNFGPLVQEFETRIAAHFAIDPQMVTTAVNGTLILISLLKALNAPPNSLCIMPSWTFVATASAAHYAGLIPYFVDVDSHSQTLHPALVKEKLKSIKKPVGAVIVIAPFGEPIDTQSWDQFTEETHIPVIIDAAAGFDTVGRMAEMSITQTPIMISLHATKVFGIGEGGLALSKNTALIRKVKSITGFGFNHDREASILGFNAKLPEYIAAVGLAALDNWPQIRNHWVAVRDQYITQLKKINISHYLSSEWVSSTCNIFLPGIADEALAQLKKLGIDTRKWWLNGCHEHPAYCKFPREKNLANTKWLSASILGLPFAMDLKKEKIEYICESIASNSTYESPE